MQKKNLLYIYTFGKNLTITNQYRKRLDYCNTTNNVMSVQSKTYTASRLFLPPHVNKSLV